jgi:hypothetical protein
MVVQVMEIEVEVHGLWWSEVKLELERGVRLRGRISGSYGLDN